jgi:hypothetical protein
LSRQPGEAEGSLTPELRVRAASSPDNDAARGDCRTARARLARRTVCDASEPVIEPPQASTPGSNPMDMGRASGARKPLFAGRPASGGECRLAACGECPRDRHAKPAGEELGTDPAKRTAVNVGTRPVSPRSLVGAGKAQCQLTAPGGGIALVVVVGVTSDRGGRESRLQGDMSRATYRPPCCAKKYVALVSERARGRRAGWASGLLAARERNIFRLA